MRIKEAVSKGFGVAKKSLGLVLVLFVFGFIFNLLNIFLVPQTAPDVTQAPPPALIVMVVFI